MHYIRESDLSVLDYFACFADLKVISIGILPCEIFKSFIVLKTSSLADASLPALCILSSKYSQVEYSDLSEMKKSDFPSRARSIRISSVTLMK